MLYPLKPPETSAVCNCKSQPGAFEFSSNKFDLLDSTAWGYEVQLNDASLVRKGCWDNRYGSVLWMADKHTSGADKKDSNGSLLDPKICGPDECNEEESGDQNLWPRWDGKRFD